MILDPLVKHIVQQSSEYELPDMDILHNDIHIDFNEHSPQQEVIINEIYERPDRPYLQEPPRLKGQRSIQMYCYKSICINKQIQIRNERLYKKINFKFNTSYLLQQKN